MTLKFENFIPEKCITFQTTKQYPLEHYLINHPNYILMDQCHSETVTILTESSTYPKTIPQTDAVISTIPETLLLVKTADCLPILLYHPAPLIAAIHAGRIGTELGILDKTLHTIKNKFKIQNNLSIWFGPHIHEKNYEIDQQTKLHYNLYIKNKAQLLNHFQKNSHQFYHLNNCTVENNPLFFSFRKEKTSLRNYAGIQIKLN